MQKLENLLRILADGRFHSGEEIARDLGCSRSAIWKRVSQLREIPGIEVDSVTGRGYRFKRRLELLDRQVIEDSLSAEVAASLQDVHIVGSVDSTNALAMSVGPQIGSGAAWFAEHQTDGRGRRGRTWVSPYGHNIYFSLAWSFDASLPEVAGLSIATGAALAEMLNSLGLSNHGLKWPNDILWNQRKLAGILLEVQGESNGPATVVIGIGINLDLGEQTKLQIDQPAVGLNETGLEIGRNRLAANLLESMAQMCREFARDGLSPFVRRWRDYDAFAGRPVSLVGPGREIAGTCVGLADDGGLRLLSDGREQVFYAGELSLRSGA